MRAYVRLQLLFIETVSYFTTNGQFYYNIITIIVVIIIITAVAGETDWKQTQQPNACLSPLLRPSKKKKIEFSCWG